MAAERNWDDAIERYFDQVCKEMLFVGMTAFELIVEQQIKRLEDPSTKCVSLVYDELVRIPTQLLGKSPYRRYPSLEERIHVAVISFLWLERNWGATLTKSTRRCHGSRGTGTARRRATLDKVYEMSQLKRNRGNTTERHLDKVYDRNRAQTRRLSSVGLDTANRQSRPVKLVKLTSEPVLPGPLG